MTQISKKEMKIFKHLQNFGNKESRIKMNRRHSGVLVEVRKSTAIDIILRMIKLKVISKDDLNDFSSELKQEIERRIAFYR